MDSMLSYLDCNCTALLNRDIFDGVHGDIHLLVYILQARYRVLCIIFLDEIDASASDRSGASSENQDHNRGLKTQLLTEMDGG